MKSNIYNFKNINIYGNIKYYKNINIISNGNIQNISFKGITDDSIREGLDTFGIFPSLDDKHLKDVLICYINRFQICTIKFDITNNQNKKIKFYNGDKYVIIENNEYSGYISNYPKLRISIEHIDNNTLIEYKNIEISYNDPFHVKKYNENIKSNNFNYKIVNNSIFDITSLHLGYSKKWVKRNRIGKYLTGKIVIKNIGNNTIYNPKIITNSIDFTKIDNIINYFTDKNNSILDNIIILFYAVTYNIEHILFQINGIPGGGFPNQILNNFVTQLNVFGFGICSNISQCFCHLINRYFKINNIEDSLCFDIFIKNVLTDGSGHFVNEIKYKNNNYYFDADYGYFFIKDNFNIMSLEECLKDTVEYLKELIIDNKSYFYVYDGQSTITYKELVLIDEGINNKIKYNFYERKLIDYDKHKNILRPNEYYIYNDDSCDNDICNYNITIDNLPCIHIPILSINYNPIFNNDFFDLDGIEYKNIIIEKEQLIKNKNNDDAYLQICTKINHLILNIEIFVETQNKEELKIQISNNKIDWFDISNYTNSYINLKNLDNDLNILDNVSYLYNDNFYEYYIRIIIDKYSIKNIILKTICICNISSSIFLKNGENVINYSDDNSTRNIEINHEWLEIYENQQISNNKLILENPPNLSIIKNDNLLFKWNKINNCEEYQFILSRFKDFKYPFRKNCNIFTKQNEYYMKNDYFIENITYYWKVRPIVNMFYNEFSEIYEFKFIR